MFDKYYHCRMADITDGTSTTTAMAEARLGRNQGRWDPTARPRDSSYRVVTGQRLRQFIAGDSYTFKNEPAYLAIINQYYNNCLGMYDAGSGWNGSSDQQGRHWASGRALWGPYITTLVGVNVGPGCDDDNSVTTVAVKEPSSYHPGGALVLRADASTDFVSDGIDQATWIALGSTRGGEAISE